MKLGITHKLFLLMFTIVLLLLLASISATRLSFESGFIGYLNDQSMARMRGILPVLQQAYRDHGNSWQFIEQRNQNWYDIIRTSRFSDEANKRPLVSDQTGAIPRMALLNPQFQPIVGHPDANQQSLLLPVVINNQPVGWLATIPFETAASIGNIHFYRQQVTSWWWIGMASTVFAASLAFFAARVVNRRILAIRQVSEALANGNFGVRLQPRSNDELSDLMCHVNQLAAALDGAEQQRRAFLADISHELRTPLAIMQADIEAMQDGIRPTTPDALAALHHQLLHLAALVTNLDLLESTRPEAERYQFLTCDLIELLTPLFNAFTQRARDRGLDLNLELPNRLTAFVDPQQIRQLMTNLLENAIRYTHEPGLVQVCFSQSAASVEITIADSAPTVADNAWEKLFERFYRAEQSRNQESGGSGLGLAICRQIVLAHSGRIEAHQSSLGGVAICVTLPLLDPDHATSKSTDH